MAIFPLYSADLMPIWCRFDALSKPSSNRHQIARTQPAGRPRAAAARQPHAARAPQGACRRRGKGALRAGVTARGPARSEAAPGGLVHCEHHVPPLTFQSCLPGVIFEENHHDGLLFLLAFFAWNCDNASVCRVIGDGGRRWANQSGRQCT